MALQLASTGARVKALIPILLGLTARSGKNSAAVEQAGHRDCIERLLQRRPVRSPAHKVTHANRGPLLRSDLEFARVRGFAR